MSENKKIQPRPAMPDAPAGGMSKWKRLFRFRRDMFAALPERLYSAWMAQVKTPFYSSFMMNQPELARRVLGASNRDFPKSSTAYGQVETLLGAHSVFVTNGAEWERQRRIINPAFEGGRVKTAFPAMQAAAAAMIERFDKLADGRPVDIEFECSHFAADVIFRTLFSMPIEHELAQSVFTEFQQYQREQPVWNVMNLVRAPKWIPRRTSRRAQASAKIIRSAIGALVDARAKAIEAGTAPDDLATKIMTMADPETGHCFTRDEMIDQVAIFFLAGHETSASALAWALYLLSIAPKVQDEVRAEQPNRLEFSNLTKLTVTRNVFMETLRLYAPVPMLVREATKPERFRDRDVKPGDLCILSPWFSGRHERIWDEPHEFRPERWNDLPAHCREAYFPFSAGERICIGAGFAQVEGWLAIASLVKSFRFSPGDDQPIPVAHLTVRSKSGVFLRIEPCAQIPKNK